MEVASLDQVKISSIGTQIYDIPNHPLAKLMYYINCISEVLELDKTRGFREYKNYNSLTWEQAAAVVEMCTLLAPVRLNNVCMFHDEKACGDSGNKFFKIEKNRTRIAAARSVMVGDVEVTIQKRMSYTMSWIKEYYVNPLTQMTLIIQEAKRQQQIVNLQMQLTINSQLLQTTYSQLQQTTYSQPQQTTNSQPQQTATSQQQQITYSQKQQTTCSQPQQTTCSQPQQITYSQRQQTTYSQPQQTTYSQPRQTTYSNSSKCCCSIL